jgi:hypothetical protein
MSDLVTECTISCAYMRGPCGCTTSYVSSLILKLLRLSTNDNSSFLHSPTRTSPFDLVCSWNRSQILVSPILATNYFVLFFDIFLLVQWTFFCCSWMFLGKGDCQCHSCWSSGRFTRFQCYAPSSSCRILVTWDCCLLLVMLLTIVKPYVLYILAHHAQCCQILFFTFLLIIFCFTFLLNA